jgi:sugar lactone lactonase YvrE
VRALPHRSGRPRVEQIEAELVLDAHAGLGEGPVWDPALRRLIWVDITGANVHRYDPERGRDESTDVGQPVGAAACRGAGALMLALRDGFGRLDLDRGELELVVELEADLPGNRMNDGACDSRGRFWAGTMAFAGDRPSGALYRLDPDLSVTRVLGDLTISNGIAWSPDERFMYFIDSPTYRVDVFDYDVEGGEIANRRTLFELSRRGGLPDGMTVDAEGLLWIAFWGAGAVRRYTPEGHLSAVIEIPASLATSCAFGGPDLQDLYITSAAGPLDPERAAKEPHAGGLFRARPGVAGLPPHGFGDL